MSRSILLIASFYFVNFISEAQSLNIERAEHYLIKDGLPDAAVTSICQDEDGFLWIGTANGLSRFDGTEFKNYYHHPDTISLPGNYIKAIAALPSHRLLICTTTGLSIFYTQKNIFRNLLIRSSSKMFPFENNFEKAVTDTNGNIWAGTQTCLFYLDTNLHIIKTLRGFSEKDLGKTRFLFVQDIKMLPGGEAIFKLESGNGWKFYSVIPSSGDVTPIDKINNEPLKFLNESLIRDVCFDEKGNAFFIKHLVDSIFYFDHSTKKIFAQQIGNNISRDQLYYNSSLFLIGQKMLGCALSDGGLLYWQNLSRPYTSKYTGKKFLSFIDQDVFCTQTDNEKNLWIGTANGLYKFTLPENKMDIVDFSDDQKKSVGKIDIEDISLLDHQSFICTSEAGFFYKSDANTWKKIFWQGEKDLHNIWSIDIFNKDSFWVATQRGMFWWRKTNNSYGPVEWPKKFEWINNLPMTAQYTDSRHLIWIGLGAGNGVAAFNPFTKKIIVYADKTFPLRYPITISEDEHGNLWMGGPDGIGLAEWNREKDVFKLFSPSYNSSFDNGVIYKIYADHNDNVWIGTESGLIKYSISNNNFKKYDIASGLASNSVYSFCADTSGNFWIGTKNGLNCMNLRTGKLINFSASFHLPQNPVNVVSFNENDNKIYFATDTSLYSITPSEWLQQKDSLKLFITGVTSSYKDLDFTSDIKLPYRDNNISVSFTALNLINGTENEYFYRLDGITHNWVSLGHTREIHFSNLAPGNYIFRVKAQNAGGAWISNEGTLPFSIATPFWEKWWFILLCLVFIVTFVYVLYRSRIRQLVFLQQVRNRIATDLHDDIGSTLTNINILTELTRASINEKEKVENFLNRIAEEAGSSGQSLDDIVWSINTVNDNFEQVAARMRRYAAELFEAPGISYSIEFDEKLSGKKIKMDQRRDVYLIFKESTNNIYKHARATVVTIDLKLEKNNFLLMIKDNGKGFDTTSTTDRNGLKNINKRTQKWKGTCNLSSAISGGTTIIISIPVIA